MEALVNSCVIIVTAFVFGYLVYVLMNPDRF